MRKPLDLLVTTKALKFVSGLNNREYFDSILTEGSEDSGSGLGYVVKNVCAKISVPLADRLDSVTGLLSVSKRAFIEAAIIEALDHAEEVMTNEGVYDVLAELKSHDVEDVLIENSVQEGGK